MEETAQAQEGRSKEKMKLTLKIAAGIFVGVFAVIGIAAILRWHSEKQRLSKEDFDKQILSLTPEQFIALCGKPDKDKLESLHIFPDDPGIRMRTLTYSRSGQSSEAVFVDGPLVDVSWGMIRVERPAPSDSKKWVAAVEIAFPCVMQTKKVLEMYRSGQEAR
jgi:hypothetical protein